MNQTFNFMPELKKEYDSNVANQELDEYQNAIASGTISKQSYKDLITRVSRESFSKLSIKPYVIYPHLLCVVLDVCVGHPLIDVQVKNSICICFNTYISPLLYLPLVSEEQLKPRLGQGFEWWVQSLMDGPRIMPR